MKHKIGLIAYQLVTILFLISGCTDPGLKRFSNLPEEEISKYKSRVESVLKNEVCPRLDEEAEIAICANLLIKISRTEGGMAFVTTKDKCSAIHVELIHIMLPEHLLKSVLAHELGHIILQKCNFRNANVLDEVAADLYSAKLFGKKSRIESLEWGPNMYIEPENQKWLRKKLALRIKILALSGW